MSAGKRRSGRRAEAACNYDVDAGGGVDIDATTSEDRSTLPVRGFGSQITGSIIHEGEPDEDDLSSSVSPGVRLHYVMKEPARLTKGSAKNLEDVTPFRFMEVSTPFIAPHLDILEVLRRTLSYYSSLWLAT